MADQFYYVDARNERIGPVTWDVLEQLHRAGALTDETLVASESESEWSTFEQLRIARARKESLPPVPAVARKTNPKSKVTVPNLDLKAIILKLKERKLLFAALLGLVLIVVALGIPRGTTDRGATPGGSDEAAKIQQANEKLRAMAEEMGSLPVTCQQCSGSGKKVLRGFCTGCRGKGTVMTPSGFVMACSQCGGSGEGVYPCDLCAGSGQVRGRF
jgi:hypothetical protein